MKTREESAKFVNNQLDFQGLVSTKREKGNAFHYGKQELRDLLDFIYEGKPSSKKEDIE